jgi:hypothetical protein
MEIRLIVGHRHERPQVLDIVTGEVNPVLLSDLGQRLQPEGALEVSVQIDLRQRV